MRIGLLTQWYDPEPGPAALPGVLARGLRDRGHDVRVLTGFPNYPTGVVMEDYRISAAMDEIRDGIRVRRVAVLPSHDSSAARRIGTYSSFGASATAFGLGALRGMDAIWVNCSPITVAWPMWAAQLGLRVPAVVHVLDLWPDTLRAAGFAGTGPAYALTEKLLGRWCRSMYATASSVAYISPGVGEVLHARGVPEHKLSYVPMWADEQVYRPGAPGLRRELGLQEDQVVLLYAGALGEAQGLQTLVEACSRVDDPRFVALLVGSGISESSLRARAEAVGAHNVRFLGRVPPSRMSALMGTADLAYVALRPHPLSRMTMPSKTQAALASAVPLLVAAEGDVADVVREAGAGFCVGPGDVEEIAAVLTRACQLGTRRLHDLGAAGRRYYEREFSVKTGVDRIERLLQGAATRRSA